MADQNKNTPPSGTHKFKIENLDFFETAMDPIFIVDSQNKYIDVNPKAIEVFGYSKEEFLNMSIFDVIPEDQKTKSEKVLMPQTKRKSYENFFGKMRTKDNRWLDVEVSSSAIVDNAEVIGSIDIVRDITQRKELERELKQSLQDKKLLMEEVHHRTKNNLTIIQSLLHMQAVKLADSESVSALRDSGDRIASISMIHELLYKTDNYKSLNAADYFNSLTTRIIKNYSSDNRPVNLTIDIDSINLAPKELIPCGLILNELLTNAFKYAFNSSDDGEIHVYFKQNEDESKTMTVRDNGEGIPANIDIHKTDTLGMTIVTALVDQLNGNLELIKDGGTEFRITFI